MMYIQLIGFDNVVRKLNSISLGKSNDEQYELIRIDDVFSIPMKILNMRCPSTKNIYPIPVHPKCNTWEEGLDWYYKGKKYKFVVET